MASAIDNLFTALKGRATYSENIADSKQVVKDIDNYELLDKASILLTPTAYSDARVHSVKTYTGDELVNSNNWINNTSGTATITDGVITFVNGTGLLTQGIISANTTYKFSVTLSNLSLGNLRITTEGGVNDKTLSTSGVHEFYLNSTSAGALFLLPQSSFTGSIDNISVTEADADFDFDRASSATRINSDGLVQDMQSITDPELVLNGDFEELGDEEVTNGTFDTDSNWVKGSGWSIADGKASCNGSSTNLNQNGVLVVGRDYKITITVTDYVSGTVEVSAGAAPRGAMSANGTYTFYQNATPTTNFYIVAQSFNGSIDNVSVQQIDPNDRWTLTQATITDGSLNLSTSDGSYTAATQTLGTIGNVYEISLDVSDIVGTISVAIGGGTDVDITTNGTHTVYITSASTTFEIKRKFGITNVSATIDNISVKDITFSEDVDLARINYDSNGENGHWLLEPTSTNLITYSEDFSEWGNARTTDTSNQATSPDGVNNATYLEQNSGQTTAGSVYLSSTISSGTNTLSVFAKKKEKDFIVLYDTNAARTYFDLNNGSVGTTPSGVTANIENYGNGWYRCSVTFTALSSGSQNVAFYLADNDSAAPITDSGGIYIWGAQLEALPYATSYIPSLTGSTVTRATETLTGSGNSTLINSTEGVLYAEIAALADDSTYRFISLNGGGYSNSIRIGYFTTSNTVEYRVVDSNAKQVEITHVISDTTDTIKLAAKYKANDFALWIDGVEVATDTSGTVPSGLYELDLNDGNTSSNSPFYGKVKALAVFDEALTDDELELLTGITNYGSFNELAQANGYTII